MRMIFLVGCFLALFGCGTGGYSITTFNTTTVTTYHETMYENSKKVDKKTYPVRNPKEQTVIKVGEEERRLPYKSGEKWVYTDVKTGKPVNPTHKLTIQ